MAESPAQRESRGKTHQKRQGKEKVINQPGRDKRARDQKDMESDEKWREREREPMRCTGRETVRLRDA